MRPADIETSKVSFLNGNWRLLVRYRNQVSLNVGGKQVALDVEEDIVEIQCRDKARSFRIVTFKCHFGIFLMKILRLKRWEEYRIGMNFKRGQ